MACPKRDDRPMLPIDSGAPMMGRQPTMTAVPRESAGAPPHDTRVSPPDPGVPPPFVFAGGVLIGGLLNVWHPLSIVTPDHWTVTWVAGAVLVALWAALAGWAMVTFVRAGTAIAPNRPASRVVTHGPFRFTRNPMYSSFVLFYLGFTLIMNSWWPFFLLPMVLLVIQNQVRREERYLSAVFGSEYDDYRLRVRRWV